MHQMIAKRLLVSSLVAAGAAGAVSACSSEAPKLPPNNPITIASKPPPPIAGGTLTVTRKGFAIASDPDRDLVWVVDLNTAVPAAAKGTPASPGTAAIPANAHVEHVALQEGDEPGRVVVDAAGRAHVVLRGAGAVATIDVASLKVTDRTSVCSVPRGIAYDKANDVLHVACAGGELVTLPAAGGPPVRELRLDKDLRDVVVQGDNLVVSRFKSAQVLLVNKDGKVINRQAPPSVMNFQEEPPTPPPGGMGGPGSDPGNTSNIAFEPTVAWRLIDLGNGTLAMAHQRSADVSVVISQPDGYGNSGGGCDGSIVNSTVTTVDGSGNPTNSQPAPTIVGASVPVDVAGDTDGNLAIASAGSSAVFLSSTSNLDAQSGPFSCDGSDTQVQVPGQPIAVASLRDVSVSFAGDWVVQTRETTSEASADATASTVPTLTIVSNGGTTAVIRLATLADNRADTGHYLFHHNASDTTALACAGCHPEGHEDGHTWIFDTTGARRTQTVSGGVLDTMPLHWNGDMKDLPMIMTVVFVNRMGGAPQGPLHIQAFGDWLQTIPAFPPSPAGTAAQIAHGKQLFESAETGCTGCHRGEHFTDNLNHDVGTGMLSNTHRDFQVPTLIGVGARAPYFHDGCAATLKDRFDVTQTACNGGDNHGHISQLSASDVDDLVAYLETL
jgi:cytochrome c553